MFGLALYVNKTGMRTQDHNLSNRTKTVAGLIALSLVVYSLICEELDKPLAAEEDEEEIKDKENEMEPGEQRKIRGRHNHGLSVNIEHFKGFYMQTLLFLSSSRLQEDQPGHLCQAV